MQIETMMKKSAIFLLLAFCISGCVTPASKINAVHLGMTKAEVIAAMGEPISMTADQSGEYLNYSLRERSTQVPYEIKLVNGKVISYGRAGVPVQRPSEPVFIPPPVIIPPPHR